MNSRFLACAALAALSLSFSGCAKKVVAKAPTPPAPQTTTPAVAATRAPARDYSQPARVASTTPSPRLPDAATRARIQDLLNRIQDAYFDYNKHTLRPDAEAALKMDAQTLADIIKQYPDFKLTVEGFADERGSDEYNLALGDARAKQTKEYLSNLGLPSNQLAVVSYGKEKPVCTEHDEDCWQKNRRTHITQAQAN
jgi:peptidoglycan-associated lipoprotein